MKINSAVLALNLHKDLCHLDSELSVYRGNVLKTTLLKKFVHGSDSALSQAAIDSFIERNDNLGNEFVISAESKGLFDRWKDIIYLDTRSSCQMTDLTLSYCLNKGYAGPGSSRSVRSTDFLGKMFDSDLSCTSSFLYTHYRSGLSTKWEQAEAIRSASHSLVVVSGSTLSTVPKDSTKMRTICTEPSLNMFYQLGAKAYFESVLKRLYYIDVSTQPDINKSFAKSASIDGSYATIDLKDASDSIHLDLCRQLLPNDIFHVLNRIRSEYFTSAGVDYKFNMISSMGNGFTFPLMTFMLSSLYKAFCEHHNLKYERIPVFGDDIIVPTEHYDKFAETLNSFGFKVNLSKSFATGFFRESCGGDFYHGFDVRGVYIKRINNEADIYSAFNRLHAWSLKHGISLYHTLRYLKGLARFRPVPLDSGVDEGFIVTQDHLRSVKTNRDGLLIYHKLKCLPRSYRISDSYVNPIAAEIAAVGGYVRDHRVGVRSNHRKYVVKRCLTHNWDYVPNPVFTRRDMSLSWSLLLSID